MIVWLWWFGGVGTGFIATLSTVVPKTIDSSLTRTVDDGNSARTIGS